MESNENPSPNPVQLYERLKKELLMVAAEFRVYAELFGPEPNVDLMNRTLPSVMRIIQDALSEAVLLGLSRLGDPARQGNHQNLTFEALIESTRIDGDASLADSLSARRTRFQQSLHDIRIWRDKSIAHLDRPVGEGLRPLPQITLQMLRTSLDLASEILNVFSQARSRSIVSYESVGFENGSASDLIRRLRESEEYRRDNPQTWMLLGRDG